MYTVYPEYGNVTAVVSCNINFVCNTWAPGSGGEGRILVGGVPDDGTIRFNGSIVLPDTTVSCESMFSNCLQYDYPINIPNNVTSCRKMFEGCQHFNKSVTIPDKVTDCNRMFLRCGELSQSITIGSNVTNCYQMFYDCVRFSQSVTIPDSVTDCRYMFAYCLNFNQSVTIGNNVSSCYRMFYGCDRFNQDVYFPDSVSNFKDSLVHNYFNDGTVNYSAHVSIPSDQGLVPPFDLGLSHFHSVNTEIEVRDTGGVAICQRMNYIYNNSDIGPNVFWNYLGNYYDSQGRIVDPSRVLP